MKDPILSILASQFDATDLPRDMNTHRALQLFYTTLNARGPPFRLSAPLTAACQYNWLNKDNRSAACSPRQQESLSKDGVSFLFVKELDLIKVWASTGLLHLLFYLFSHFVS